LKKNKNIVVFASGSGTNFINIFKKIQENFINGKIVLLISNNPNCGAANFAKENKVDVEIINIYRNKSQKNIDNKYEMLLDYYKADLILLAGFMKKIPLNIVKIYKNKIINIHPSLLPNYGGEGYYGMKVHQAVISNKEKFTGATIHFVNREYDKGMIILQKKINITEDDNADSVAKKVLKIEYEIYLRAIELLCTNKIIIENNKVEINEKN